MVVRFSMRQSAEAVRKLIRGRFLRNAFCCFGLASLLLGTTAAESGTGYKHLIKKNSDDSWTLIVTGLQTDNPNRIDGLSQLHAAQHVISKGYTYFRLLDKKKSIRCLVSKEFGTVTGGYAEITSRFKGAKTNGYGFIDANLFVGNFKGKLLAEPSAIAKQKVSTELSNHCIARHKPADYLY